MGRIIEVSTVGIDEALAGLSSDPFGAPFVSAVGLRVPAFVPPAVGIPAIPSNRYLFLLCSVQVGARQTMRVKGWRQYVTIGVETASGTTPSRPVELAVETPSFRFPDGNISWHLVREPPQDPIIQRPNTDQPNFLFVDSDGPALLYQTTAFSALTGYYMKNMTAYVPPLKRQGTWEPIAGLGNVHDLRTHWQADHAWDSLGEDVTGPCRISFYASVLQTNPATRPAPTAVTFTAPPEELFIKQFANVEGDGSGVIYWRVAGAMMLEDVTPRDTTVEDCTAKIRVESGRA